jgi:hypothetical protein
MVVVLEDVDMVAESSPGRLLWARIIRYTLHLSPQRRASRFSACNTRLF